MSAGTATAPLVGWTVDQLARAAGLDRATALRELRAGVERGEVVRLESGGRVLFARLGAPLSEVAPDPATAPAVVTRPAPNSHRPPTGDHRSKRRRNR